MPEKKRYGNREDEATLHERLRAEQCLKNAHQQIAVAFAHIGGEHMPTPGHWRRTISELTGAVDWLRRALESLDRLSRGEPQ